MAIFHSFLLVHQRVTLVISSINHRSFSHIHLSTERELQRGPMSANGGHYSSLFMDIDNEKSHSTTTILGYFLHEKSITFGYFWSPPLQINVITPAFLCRSLLGEFFARGFQSKNNDHISTASQSCLESQRMFFQFLILRSHIYYW